MIYLHTGAPGAGKTLSAMEFIAAVLTERPDRVVYSNINGITYPGVIVVDEEWMAEWWDRATPGSLVVIDEAQKIWRATRGGGDPGRAITDLETHRHDGIDIVMITQHPTLIHANIRKLVTRHVHVVEYTKDTALRWEWRECHDDVMEANLRQQGDFKEWRYPKAMYGYYISAVEHTKRTKLPRGKLKGRILMGVSLSLVLLLVGALAIKAPEVWRRAQGFGKTASGSTGTASKTGGVLAGERSATPVVLTTAQYVAQQLPRLQEQPWSAPIFDGQSVTTHPQVWCIAPELPAHCTCITEQGTHYAMEDAHCRKYAAEGGTYDPYKPQRKDDDNSRSVPATPGAPQGPSVASVDAGMPGGIPAPRESGVGAQEYTPPTYGKWDPNYFGSGK